MQPRWTEWMSPKKTRAAREMEIRRILQTPVFQAARVVFTNGRANRRLTPPSSLSPEIVRKRQRQEDLDHVLKRPRLEDLDHVVESQSVKRKRQEDLDRDEIVKRQRQEDNDELLRFSIRRELGKLECLVRVSVHPHMLRMRSDEVFDEGSVRAVHSRLTSLCRTCVGGGSYHDCISRVLQHDYYIGICCSPFDRWTGAGDRGEHRKEYDSMTILAAGDAPCVGQLEKDLISMELGNPGCRNKGPGGERCAPKGTQAFLYLCLEIALE